MFERRYLSFSGITEEMSAFPLMNACLLFQLGRNVCFSAFLTSPTMRVCASLRKLSRGGDEVVRARVIRHIPHICHFFYTDRIFGNQILHPKKRLKAPKKLKMSLKKSNICIFSLNLEKFTPDRNFLHRHVCGVCNKYEVWFNTGKKWD